MNAYTIRVIECLESKGIYVSHAESPVPTSNAETVLKHIGRHGESGDTKDLKVDWRLYNQRWAMEDVKPLDDKGNVLHASCHLRSNFEASHSLASFILLISSFLFSFFTWKHGNSQHPQTRKNRRVDILSPNTIWFF